MKARALAAVAASLVAVSAQAQTMPPEVTEPVTITFYNYNLASAGNGAEATKKMIAEFEALHPNITVQGVPVKPQELVTRVQADIVAGQPVDLSQMTFNALGFAAENLNAAALEDIVPAEELAAHFEGMVPNGLELGRIDGKTYGLAYTFSTPVLFYNADIFREVGLDPENPPQTWDEVAAAGRIVKAKTDYVPLASGIFGPSALDWLMQGILRSNGGAAINAERTRMTFAEPEGVEALTMLRGLAKEGVIHNLDIQTQIQTMASGQAAMYLQTSAVQGYLLRGAEGNFELRATTMPRFGDKPAAPSNSGSSLAIHASDPVKQRAAWELMKFLTSERGYTIITSEIGYLPLRPATLENPEHLGEWIKANPLIRPNLKQLEIMQPWTPMPGPNYLQIETTMMDAMEMATFGDDDDVEGLLAAAQAQAQGMLP